MDLYLLSIVEQVIVKRKHHFSRINDLFDQIQGAYLFSNIDLRFCYHYLKITNFDIPEKNFGICYGYYENLMSFCLTKAHTTFIEFMNIVIRHYLNLFVIVFYDDILVYSKTKEDHA